MSWVNEEEAEIEREQSGGACLGGTKLWIGALHVEERIRYGGQVVNLEPHEGI